MAVNLIQVGRVSEVLTAVSEIIHEVVRRAFGREFSDSERAFGFYHGRGGSVRYEGLNKISRINKRGYSYLTVV